MVMGGLRRRIALRKRELDPSKELTDYPNHESGMSVTISFRGPMVVVTKGASVSRILIPNAEAPAAGEMGAAKPHTLGVIHLDAARAEKNRFVVPHGSIMISAESAAVGAPCEKDPTVDALASLRDLIDGSNREPLQLKPDDDASLAACVRFAGGKLTSRLPSLGIYQFPSIVNPNPPLPRFLPLITDWTTPDASATIAFADGRAPLQVDDGDHVYVVNIDGFTVAPKFPKAETMEYGQQISCIGTHEDPDFRLAYLTLRPKTAPTLSAWLALPGKLMPAPFFVTNPIDEIILGRQIGQKTEEFRESVDGYIFDPGSQTDCMHGRYEE